MEFVGVWLVGRRGVDVLGVGSVLDGGAWALLGGEGGEVVARMIAIPKVQ